MDYSQHFPPNEINALTKLQGTFPESFQWPKRDVLDEVINKCVLYTMQTKSK